MLFVLWMLLLLYITSIYLSSLIVMDLSSVMKISCLTMSIELHRLSSFCNALWKPAPGKPSSCFLARIGFYHCENADAVTCYKCHIMIETSHLSDNPEAQHRSLSPNCEVTSDNVTLVQPQEILAQYKNKTVLRDTLDSCLPVPDVVKNIYRILVEAFSRAKRNGAIAVEEPIAIDTQNPDFDLLRNEQVRLSTFTNWPRSAHVTPVDLARAGFFYSGMEDRVQCAFCHGFLRKWVAGDVPEREHRKHFPNCSFVRGTDAGNLPVISNDSLQLSSSLQSLSLVETSRSTAPAARAPAASAANVQRLSSSTQMPKHPEFASEAARLKSFEGKTLPRGQDIKVMASAGYYHVGPHDNVKCFYCDGGLKNWQPNDDPWEEHAKWFPRCGYLLTQRDPNYVGMIQDVYRPDLLMQNNLPRNLTGTPLALPAVAVGTAGAARYTFEPREIKARMDSPSVKAVINMGFPRELVRQAIQLQLSSTGDDFQSTQNLVEAVMQLEEQQQMGLLGSSLQASSSNSSSAATAVPSTSFSTARVAVTTPSVELQSADARDMNFPVPEAVGASVKSVVNVSEPPTKEEPAAKQPVAQKQPAVNTAAETAPQPAAPVKSTKSKKRNKKKKAKNAAANDVETPGNDDKETDVKPDPSAIENEVKAAAAAAGLVEEDEAKSLYEENRQLKEAKTCKICMDEEVNIVFLPCGHLSCCSNCAPALRNCPICRSAIRGTVRTYLS